MYIDVDIENCFPTLLWKELIENVGDAARTDFDVLYAFVFHYRAWRAALADYFDIPLKASKKLLISILHLAAPMGELPFLWALSVQIKQAVDIILSSDKFQHLNNMFASRRQPVASRLHFALASVEDFIVQQAELAMLKDAADSAVMTYMFDGAVFRIPEVSLGAARASLDRIAQREGMAFTVDVFPSLDAEGGAGGNSSRSSASEASELTDMCLPTCFQNYGFPVDVRRSGPFWILKDDRGGGEGERWLEGQKRDGRLYIQKWRLRGRTRFRET